MFFLREMVGGGDGGREGADVATKPAEVKENVEGEDVFSLFFS